MPSPCPLPDTTQSAAAGLCPHLGVPGLCRHLAGQAGGWGGGRSPSPTLADGCPRRLAWGAALCPPSPVLDQAEANAHAHGLTSHAAAQTKPEPTAVALGPGPGPEAAMLPALGLLGGLGRLLVLGGPHRTWWPGWGCKSGQAPHTVGSPGTQTLWTLRRPFWWARGVWGCLRWVGGIRPFWGAKDWRGQGGQLGPRI